VKYEMDWSKGTTRSVRNVFIRMNDLFSSFSVRLHIASALNCKFTFMMHSLHSDASRSGPQSDAFFQSSYVDESVTSVSVSLPL
jgi:hypothetical protein